MFDKAYSSQGGHGSDIAFQAQLKDSMPYLDSLKEAYKPKRRFKRTEKLAFASKAAHVQYVLLEYGDKGTSAATAATEGQSEEEVARAAALQAMAAGMAEEEDEEEALDEDLVDDEMRSKLAAAGAAGRASKGQVGSLVGMSSEEIAQAKAAYDAEQEQGDLQSRLGLADAHKRQVASLEKQIEACKQSRQAYLPALLPESSPLEALQWARERGLRVLLAHPGGGALEAGSGLILLGPEGGFTEAEVSGLVEGGAAAAHAAETQASGGYAYAMPNDALIAVYPGREGSLGYMLEAASYDATIEAIGQALSATPPGAPITLTLGRIVRRGRAQVTAVDPDGSESQFVCYEGENLRMGLLRRGLRLNDQTARRYDNKPAGTGDCGGNGLCATCVVSVLSGGVNLTPKRPSEKNLLSRVARQSSQMR